MVGGLVVRRNEVQSQLLSKGTMMERVGSSRHVDGNGIVVG